MYVRNFSQGVGLTWQSVFQTSDRAEVESYCRRNGIGVEWKEDGGLRTRRVLPATCRHPRSGEEIWFNHATFFHLSTLAPAVREGLVAAFSEQDLPNQTYYGDGTPIEPEALETLRAAYLSEKVVFPWQRGDVLMLDNMLTAHAREPFRGERRILTGMARPSTRE
jgi:alpha-ketoglutarate-dependent taurine dioxygenase